MKDYYKVKKGCVESVILRVKLLQTDVWKSGYVIIAVIFAFILSIVIEFTQYYFRLGRSEVDDVIMNTLGAAIGASSYIIALHLQRFYQKKD